MPKRKRDYCPVDEHKWRPVVALSDQLECKWCNALADQKRNGSVKLRACGSCGGPTNFQTKPCKTCQRKKHEAARNSSE